MKMAIALTRRVGLGGRGGLERQCTCLDASETLGLARIQPSHHLNSSQDEVTRYEAQQHPRWKKACLQPDNLTWSVDADPMTNLAFLNHLARLPRVHRTNSLT